MPIQVTIILEQNIMFENTEEIIREIIKDTFGQYIPYDPNKVDVKFIDSDLQYFSTESLKK